MNKQELIELIKREINDWKEKFVVEWYELAKNDLEQKILDYMANDFEDDYSNFGEWMDNPANKPFETLIRMQDGYEIEQEPKWVIRSNEDESFYLTEFEITPKHGVRDLWGHKYEASQLSDKDLAQYTAYVVNGTAELVEVAE